MLSMSLLPETLVYHRQGVLSLQLETVASFSSTSTAHLSCAYSGLMFTSRVILILIICVYIMREQGSQGYDVHLSFLEVVCLRKRMPYKMHKWGQDIHLGGRKILCLKRVGMSSNVNPSVPTREPCQHFLVCPTITSANMY